MNIISNNFTCKKCNYCCSHKGDWNKHINTKKHIMLHNNNNNKMYICKCGKKYSFKSGLSRHQKHCTIKEKEIENKHIQSLQEWKKNNPNWETNDTLIDEYIQLTQKVAINL